MELWQLALLMPLNWLLQPKVYYACFVGEWYKKELTATALVEIKDGYQFYVGQLSHGIWVVVEKSTGAETGKGSTKHTAIHDHIQRVLTHEKSCLGPGLGYVVGRFYQGVIRSVPQFYN